VLSKQNMCVRLDGMSAPSIRARVRAEMTDEIKTIARRHLAVDGANLSLRAVARDLGVVSSAIYRYFASRDDLLTALIIDAYNAVGQAAEDANASVEQGDLPGRWLAVAHAIRDWALEVPHEYMLIYGSPVPGYKAPQDTVGAAIRSTLVLGGILRDGVAAGVIRSDEDQPLPKELLADLSKLRADAFPTVPESVLARGMGAWIQLFGTVSFELGGQFNNVLNERRVFFDHQMRALSRYIGVG
jgi:AcrR family transcriptional regulator